MVSTHKQNDDMGASQAMPSSLTYSAHPPHSSVVEGVAVNI